MKKIFVAGLFAIGMLAITQQQASAWVNSKFGVGLNWDLQSGGNQILWGMWRNGQPPGPESMNAGPYAPNYRGPMAQPGPSFGGAPQGYPAQGFSPMPQGFQGSFEGQSFEPPFAGSYQPPFAGGYQSPYQFANYPRPTYYYYAPTPSYYGR